MNREYFLNVCNTIVNQACERSGIGTLSEKTLHAVLKLYFEADTEYHEVKTGNYYADIRTPEDIIEIQTKQFNRLRDKLKAFLPKYHVTVVYPIAYEKKLFWIDMETGEISGGRRSTKKGVPQQIFYELYKIKNYLKDDNLSLCITMVNIDEYRYLSGYSKDKKRGSECSDRIPTDIIDEIYLDQPGDYACLIPEGLPLKFTVKDFAKACHLTEYKAQFAVNVLNYLDVISRTGKRGRAYLYTTASSSTNITTDRSMT